MRFNNGLKKVVNAIAARWKAFLLCAFILFGIVLFRFFNRIPPQPSEKWGNSAVQSNSHNESTAAVEVVPMNLISFVLTDFGQSDRPWNYIEEGEYAVVVEYTGEQGKSSQEQGSRTQRGQEQANIGSAERKTDTLSVGKSSSENLTESSTIDVRVKAQVGMGGGGGSVEGETSNTKATSSTETNESTLSESNVLEKSENKSTLREDILAKIISSGINVSSGTRRVFNIKGPYLRLRVHFKNISNSEFGLVTNLVIGIYIDGKLAFDYPLEEKTWQYRDEFSDWINIPLDPEYRAKVQNAKNIDAKIINEKSIIANKNAYSMEKISRKPNHYLLSIEGNVWQVPAEAHIKKAIESAIKDFSVRCGIDLTEQQNGWIYCLEKPKTGNAKHYVYLDRKELSQTPTQFGSVVVKYIGDDKNRKAGDQFEWRINDDVKMTFRWCPSGIGYFGRKNAEPPDLLLQTKYGYLNEEYREKEISGFWIAETETTQNQWTAVMDTNPSCFKGVLRPVESITFDEASEFSKKVMKNVLPEGFWVAIPTEAQWEYACLAGQRSDRKGDTDTAHFDSPDDTTADIKTKRPNEFGLFDMFGNVHEFVQGLFDEPNTVGFRGGDYRFDIPKSFSRRRLDCDVRKIDHKASNLGFRVVLNVVTQPKK